MTSKFERELQKAIDEQVRESIDTETGEVTQEVPDFDGYEELAPVVYEPKESNITVSENNKDLDDDYKFARSNLYALVGKSNAALELALKLAVMSESPRALEIVATIMKSSSDMSRQLLELHKAVGKESKNTESGNITSYQQHNYYGSEPSKTPAQNDLDIIDAQLEELDDFEDLETDET